MNLNVAVNVTVEIRRTLIFIDVEGDPSFHRRRKMRDRGHVSSSCNE